MRLFLIILVIPMCVLLSGCFGISNDFRDYQKDFSRYSGINMTDKEIEFSLGRFQLYLAEKMAAISDRDLLIEMTIHDISRFEIGVYEINEKGRSKENNFAKFEENLKEKGWIKFIRAIDGNDISNVYLNLEAEDDEINELMIISTDSENAILMRMEGNFNRIVERLIRTRKLALK